VNAVGRARPQDIVLAMKDMVSPPQVYSRLLAVLDRRDWTVGDIAAVIERDAGVASRTLRLANSPYYGMYRRVSTVADAVAVLGTAELQTLVLATSVLESFTGIPPGLLSLQDHWRRAVRVSAVATCLAKASTTDMNTRELLIAGLLHDVGSLVVCLVLPEQAREAMLTRLPEEPGQPACLECEVTGERAAVVGGTLLEHWSLPASLCDAVTWHTAPGEQHERRVAFVHVAWRVSQAMENGIERPEQAIPVEDPAWRLAGLRAPDVLDLMGEAESEFRSAMALFGLS